jgi:hypothetical protein
MKPDRFDVLAASPIRWAYEAHRQYIVGASFTDLDRAAHARCVMFVREQGRDLSSEALENFQQARAYTQASMLHFGFAIENAYKTRKLNDGVAIVQQGKIKNLRTDHDVLAMVRDYRIAIDDSEIDILRSITFAAKSMGKYPIALDAKKQAEFTGRTFGPDFTAPLTRRVCVEVLRDDRLVSIFLEGALSGIDDTA